MRARRARCKSAMNPIHLIALGANLPAQDGSSPRATCERALLHLASLPGLQLQARSRWFSTAPVPPSGQPRYINGVARLAGHITPADLLTILQDYEARAGRVRGAPNAARTLDLDIIDMNGLVRDAPDPILPHPRAHLRAFVLLPLRDVAPEWRHARLNRSVGELLKEVKDKEVVLF
jgi:2-amino-4-hydroxy-6-hydroxymethyldihydropteridine diphosphokinase